MFLIYFACILRTDLVPAYVRLLRDNEAEVRIAAAGKVTKFCRILNPELAIQHILPCVKVLVLLKISLFILFCWVRIGIYLLPNFSLNSRHLNALQQSFSGIVIRFFPTCPFCFGFRNNGDGSCPREGKILHSGPGTTL